MKLRIKISLWFVCAILVMGILASILGARMLANVLWVELEKKGVTIAKHITTHISYFLVEDNLFGLQEELLIILEDDPDVSYLYIIGFDGEVVAHTFEDGFPTDLTNINIISKGKSNNTQYLINEGENITDIGYRIIGKSKAEVHVGLSEESITKAVAKLRRIMNILVIIMLFLTVTIFTYLTNLFTKPLQLLAHSASVFGATGKYENLPVISQDEVGELISAFNRMVIERKQAEEALKKAKEGLERQNIELKKIDKIKDSLIRDVTHELKTPVAKHSMQLEILEEILQKHNLMDKAQNAIRVMKTSIKRQEDVIRNILDLSRLEAGGREYKKEKVHIDRILKDIFEDYRYAVDMYGIKTKMDLETVTIQSDGEMLSHVFSNIINNAIKYRKKDVKARIDILCEKKEEVAKIEITDNGIGLSKEEKEKAFDRFYQVSPSAEGSGVGLTISKMIVEDLGGKIWLESTGRGRGTTAIVQLYLPKNKK